MTVRNIIRMGHPTLRKVSQPVTDPTLPENLQILTDMVDTLEHVNGAGLAAPQINVPIRMVIFHVPAMRTEEPLPMTVLVNPVIEPLDDEQDEDWEGCLSVPGLRGLVPRYSNIRYSGYGIDGQRIERQASGFHARVVQHECDHLDGILYPQRMVDLRWLVYESEWPAAVSELRAERNQADDHDQ